MQKKIRIAIILTPVEFGGAERLSLTLIKNINYQYIDLVPILLTRPWEQDNLFIQELKKDKYQYHEIPVGLKLKGDFLRVARCYRLVLKIIREGNFDLIHTNGYFADIVTIPIARKLGIPCLATCHGFIENTCRLKFYTRLDCFFLKFCSKIIAVSETIKEKLIKSGLKASNLCVIVNAVDFSEGHSINRVLSQKNKTDAEKTEKQLILGYAGRLSKEKGLSYLLTACSQLAKIGLTYRMLILGEGSQREELESIAQNLNLQEKVMFVGFKKDIQNLLYCMDIFILPSLTEGTPMALLEAMACGVPVIATAVGGIPQIIENGKNGILISPGKPEEITNAVLALHSNIQMRGNLAENAYSLVKSKFSVDHWIKKIEAEYIKLCELKK